jgi:hypothetical protein
MRLCTPKATGSISRRNAKRKPVSGNSIRFSRMETSPILDSSRSSRAMGRQFGISDGTLVQIARIVEDGKYLWLTEDEEPTILMPSMLTQAFKQSVFQ